MCISPQHLSEFGLVACRKCWQCRDNRVDDLCGRCIAETSTSDQTLSVTLTYDDKKLARTKDLPDRRAHAHTLVYKDVQLFLKRLRNHGYNPRYIVTGEYGSDAARAHWHIILFLRGKKIDVESLKSYFGPKYPGGYDNRVAFDHWPHGFCYFQKPEYKAFRYALKYVLKDQQKEVQTTHLAMSKKPPLGHDWIINRAWSIARDGLPVHDFAYSFRDQFKRLWDGSLKRRSFLLRGVMRERFLFTYVNAWRILHASEPPETELLLEHWFDPIAKKQMDSEWDYVPKYELASNIGQKYRTLDKLEHERFADVSLLSVTLYTLDNVVTITHDNKETYVYFKGQKPWLAIDAKTAKKDVLERSVKEQVFRDGKWTNATAYWTFADGKLQHRSHLAQQFEIRELDLLMRKHLRHQNNPASVRLLP